MNINKKSEARVDVRDGVRAKRKRVFEGERDEREREGARPQAESGWGLHVSRVRVYNHKPQVVFK